MYNTREGDTKVTGDQHAVLSSGGIVYGIRADGLFCRTWSVFDVAGKQLEQISAGLREWESTYRGIYN